MGLRRLLESAEVVLEDPNNTINLDSKRTLPKFKTYKLDRNGELNIEGFLTADFAIEINIYSNKIITQPTVWWVNNSLSSKVSKANIYPVSAKHYSLELSSNSEWSGVINRLGIEGVNIEDIEDVKVTFRSSGSITRPHFIEGVSKKGISILPGQRLRINSYVAGEITFNFASKEEEGYIFIVAGKSTLYATPSPREWSEYKMMVDSSKEIIFENIGGTTIILGNLFENNNKVESEKPNIIFVIADSLRFDRLGKKRNKSSITPTLDYLKEGGVNFERMYTQGTWTSPAFISMLTGKYSQKHNPLNPSIGNDSDIAKIKPETPSFVSELGNNGYNCIGLHAGPVISHFNGYSELFDHYEDYTVNNVGDPFMFAGKKGVDRTVDLLSNEQNNFVMLHLLDTHSPFGPPDFDVSEYNGDFKSVGWSTYLVGRERFLDKTDKTHVERLYDSGVKYVDDLVAQLKNSLKDRGLLDNTVIIFTSDHGEQLNDSELWEHHHGHAVKEELTRVPLIMWGPHYIPRNKTINTISELKDIGSMILNIVGIENEEKIFSDDAIKENKYAISLIGRYRNKASIVEQTTNGQLNKYVFCHGDNSSEELYYLNEDPGEKNNIIKENTTLAQKLRKKVLKELNSNISSKKLRVSVNGTQIIGGRTYLRFKLKDKINFKFSRVRITNVRNLYGKTLWWNELEESEMLVDKSNKTFFIPALDCPSASRFHIKLIDEENIVYSATCGGEGPFWELYGPITVNNEKLLWVRTESNGSSDNLNIEMWFHSFSDFNRINIDVQDVFYNKGYLDVYFRPKSEEPGLYTVKLRGPSMRETLNCFSQTYNSFTYPTLITLQDHTDHSDQTINESSSSVLKIYSPYKLIEDIRIFESNGNLFDQISFIKSDTNATQYNQQEGYFSINLNKHLVEREYDIHIKYFNGRFVMKRINGLNNRRQVLSANEDNVNIRLKDLGYIE